MVINRMKTGKINYCMRIKLLHTNEGAHTSLLQTIIIGQGSGPIHMSNVGCTGTESSLTDCPHIRQHSCSHSDDAAVQCLTSKLNSSYWRAV